MASYNYTFQSGDTVTPTKLNDARTVSNIVNADISNSAAIAGTKVAPNFGSQNITTTGVVRLNGASVGTFGAVATGIANPQVSLTNNADANNSPFVVMRKSRADGLTNGDDVLGSIVWQSHDGTEYRSTAGITGVGDGTATNSSLPSRLAFLTTPNGQVALTERMRITADGNVLIGSTSGVNASSGSVDGFTVFGSRGMAGVFQASNDDNACAFLRRRNGNGAIIGFFRDTTQVGSIGVTATATAYNTSSDYRLKDNATPLTSGLATINQLAPVEFTWKSDNSIGRGFIAHELQAVVPEAVTGEKDAVDAEGNPQYQGVDAAKLVPYLVSAVKELKTRVEALEAA